MHFEDHRGLRLEQCSSIFKNCDHGEPCYFVDLYDLAYRALGAATFLPGSARWSDARVFERFDDHPWIDAAGDAHPGLGALRMRYRAEGRVVVSARLIWR